MHTTHVITFNELRNTLTDTEWNAYGRWAMHSVGYDRAKLAEYADVECIVLDHCYPSELPAMCQPQAL